MANWKTLDRDRMEHSRGEQSIIYSVLLFVLLETLSLSRQISCVLIRIVDPSVAIIVCTSQ